MNVFARPRVAMNGMRHFKVEDLYELNHYLYF